MQIKEFSQIFDVNKLSLDNLEQIYNLCKMNRLYYQYCPPFVTKESINRDMLALPPNKSIEDKFYIGFFDENKLIAIMDFIRAYPFDDFCFIGFFMVDKGMQNNGFGSSIIEELCKYLIRIKYKGIRLAWVESNYQAEKFWKNNGFRETGDKNITDDYTMIIAERLFKESPNG